MDRTVSLRPEACTGWVASPAELLAALASYAKARPNRGFVIAVWRLTS